MLFVDDSYLVDKGLRNYWGYNSLAFFAPEPRYLKTPFANEFKTMVNQFHAHGSRSFSMLFTTTRRKATSWVRRFLSKASTTRAITA